MAIPPTIKFKIIFYKRIGKLNKVITNFSNYRPGKLYDFIIDGITYYSVVVLEKAPHKLRLKLSNGITNWYTNEELTSVNKTTPKKVEKHPDASTPTPQVLKVDIEPKPNPEVIKAVKTVEKQLNDTPSNNHKLISSTIHLGDLLKSEQEVDHKYAYLSLRHDVRVLLDKHGFKTNAHMKISEILTILDKALTI